MKRKDNTTVFDIALVALMVAVIEVFKSPIDSPAESEIRYCN